MNLTEKTNKLLKNFLKSHGELEEGEEAAVVYFNSIVIIKKENNNYEININMIKTIIVEAKSLEI